MIDSIHIKNFQTHQDSKLEFHPGVNIITGSTNIGKSSIIEAIKWNILNSLRGDGFKSDFAKAKDKVSCKIVVDDITVERFKDKSNGYTINGGTSLEAIGTKVPSEIQKIINMGEINIQGQFDPMFFLQDSPGEVGRKINNVVGLEIIDKSIKEVNTRIRNLNNEVARCQKNIEETGQAIEDLSIVDIVSKDIKSIDEMIMDLDLLTEDINDLDGIINSMEDIEIEVKKVSKLISLNKEVDELLLSANKLSVIEERTKKIGYIIDYIKSINNQLAKTNKILELNDDVNIILKIREDLSTTKEFSKKLGGHLLNIRIANEHIITFEQQENDAEYELHELWDGVEVCPFCGGDMK